MEKELKVEKSWEELKKGIVAEQKVGRFVMKDEREKLHWRKSGIVVEVYVLEDAAVRWNRDPRRSLDVAESTAPRVRGGKVVELRRK